LNNKRLSTLGITILFGKLKDHEHEILRLKSSEEDLKKKERKPIAFNTTLSMATSLVQDESESDEDSLNEE
jgi:hypothetical protein